MAVRILIGDVRTRLADVPDASVHTCVTSPPYFGLRDYGHDGQIGLEATPDAFVAELVAVFREVRRVLRDDGTLWLNLGDSYARAGGWSDNSGLDGLARGESGRAMSNISSDGGASQRLPAGLKSKDLIGIPWRVAFALQADGWYLRSDIIWHKPNPMPESVTDRPTKSHEYIFLLSKSEKYHYDHEAIKEDAVTDDPRVVDGFGNKSVNGKHKGDAQSGEFRKQDAVGKRTYTGFNESVSLVEPSGKRNKRSVWTVPTSPFRGAHFATFPPALIEPCILAGTSAYGCCPECRAPWNRVIDRAPKPSGRSDETTYTGQAYDTPQSVVWGSKKNLGGDPRPTTTLGWMPGCDCEQVEDADGVFIERHNEVTDRYAYIPVPCTVLDPFGGAGTTGLVADRLGRNAILCELNPAYAAMAVARIRDESPMFAEVTAA